MSNFNRLFETRDVGANDNTQRPQEFFSVEWAEQCEHLIRHMTALRETDPFSYIARDVDEQTQRITNVLDSQIYDWIMKSSATDWSKHPTFYYALIVKLQARGLVG